MTFQIITGSPDHPDVVQAETAADALLLAQTSLDEDEEFEIKGADGALLTVEALETLAAFETER